MIRFPVVDAFGAACNAHDLERALACCAEDVIFEGTTPPDGVRGEGRAEVRSIWEPIFANLADTASKSRRRSSLTTGWCSDADTGGVSGHVRAVDVYRVVDGLIAEKLSYVKG